MVLELFKFNHHPSGGSVAGERNGRCPFKTAMHGSCSQK